MSNSIGGVGAPAPMWHEPPPPKEQVPAKQQVEETVSHILVLQRQLGDVERDLSRADGDRTLDLWADKLRSSLEEGHHLRDSLVSGLQDQINDLPDDQINLIRGDNQLMSDLRRVGVEV